MSSRNSKASDLHAEIISLFLYQILAFAIPGKT